MTESARDEAMGRRIAGALMKVSKPDGIAPSQSEITAAQLILHHGINQPLYMTPSLVGIISIDDIHAAVQVLRTSLQHALYDAQPREAHDEH